MCVLNQILTCVWGIKKASLFITAVSLFAQFTQTASSIPFWDVKINYICGFTTSVKFKIRVRSIQCFLSLLNFQLRKVYVWVCGLWGFSRGEEEEGSTSKLTKPRYKAIKYNSRKKSPAAASVARLVCPAWEWWGMLKEGWSYSCSKGCWSLTPLYKIIDPLLFPDPFLA